MCRYVPKASRQSPALRGNGQRAGSPKPHRFLFGHVRDDARARRVAAHRQTSALAHGRALHKLQVHMRSAREEQLRAKVRLGHVLRAPPRAALCVQPVQQPGAPRRVHRPGLQRHHRPHKPAAPARPAPTLALRPHHGHQRPRVHVQPPAGHERDRLLQLQVPPAVPSRAPPVQPPPLPVRVVVVDHFARHQHAAERGVAVAGVHGIPRYARARRARFLKCEKTVCVFRTGGVTQRLSVGNTGNTRKGIVRLSLFANSRNLAMRCAKSCLSAVNCRTPAI